MDFSIIRWAIWAGHLIRLSADSSLILCLLKLIISHHHCESGLYRVRKQWRHLDMVLSRCAWGADEGQGASYEAETVWEACCRHCLLWPEHEDRRDPWACSLRSWAEYQRNWLTWFMYWSPILQRSTASAFPEQLAELAWLLEAGLQCDIGDGTIRSFQKICCFW